MADLDPTAEEEAAACSGLRSLIDETLTHLKGRVDFIHDCWHGKSNEEKAQYGWCLVIGVLARGRIGDPFVGGREPASSCKDTQSFLVRVPFASANLSKRRVRGIA